MLTPISTDQEASEPVVQAICLLDQQLWCWGRDILRHEGNWLLNLGFTRTKPPPERKDCSSVYRLCLPFGRSLLLRGFGVLYSAEKLGTIFLPRYEFRPLFSNSPEIEKPPWKLSDLPTLRRPSATTRNACGALLLELLEWIHDYEAGIIEHLGVEYRRATLEMWDDGERVVFPAEVYANAWRELVAKASANTEAYL